jgi:hypothetical protein
MSTHDLLSSFLLVFSNYSGEKLRMLMWHCIN